MKRKIKSDIKVQNEIYLALKNSFAFYSNDNAECMAVQKSLVELGEKFVKIEGKIISPVLVAGSKVYFGSAAINQFIDTVKLFRK